MEIMPSASQGVAETRTQTITLAGEFDFCNQDALTRTLRAAEEADVVHIDMADVQFIDSSAITCLVRLKKRMTENGRIGTVHLQNVSPQIARVFGICGLDKIFEIDER